MASSQAPLPEHKQMEPAHVEHQTECHNEELPPIPRRIPQMPPSHLHELSRAIGGLEATVATLTKMVDEERNAASSHRQALRETIAALSEAVRALTQKVGDMHPVVEESRQQLAEQKGRAKLRAALMGLWLSLSSAFGAFVGWALSHWK